ncbi:hypothetical protein [Streptomyces sp. NPDC001980]|uniref:hypothetical protein n=1 Tax=Streptomyces sp. NPDC001980 TaxID=3157126 RepID=UPI00331E30FC
MKQKEPDFWVLEYITITKDPRTNLVVAIGGNEQAADILQRTGGFLSAPGPRGNSHRSAPPRLRHRPAAPRKPPGRSRTAPGPPASPPNTRRNP